MYQSEYGYIQFVVFLLLAAGVLTLSVDTRLYRAANHRREGKYAFVLGCFNIAAAVLVWVANWLVSAFAP